MFVLAARLKPRRQGKAIGAEEPLVHRTCLRVVKWLQLPVTPMVEQHIWKDFLFIAVPLGR